MSRAKLFSSIAPRARLVRPYGRAVAASPQARAGDRGFSILHRAGPWRDALRRRMLVLADATGVVIAVAVAGELEGGLPFVSGVLLLPIWILLAKLYGLYDRDHRSLRHLTVDELRAIVAWSATATATQVLVLATIGDGGIPASSALALGFAAFVVVAPLRAGARALWRKIVPPDRTLIVGSGTLEQATRRKLELFSDIHARTIGVLDDQLLGDVWLDGALEARIEEAVDGQGIDRIIVASRNVSEPLLTQHVAYCRRAGVRLSVVPPVRAMFGTAVNLHHIADLPMIEYSTWDIARSTMAMKRMIDVGVSLAALVVLAPLMLACALAIRMSSPGPALFRHLRAGCDGVPFRILKFRTMHADAEQRLCEVIDTDALPDPMFKLRDDARVTRLGRFLRRTSLDELPQLINVVRGEMSLVGPRPEQLDMVERYAADDRFRLSVKPGMTGPMQVYGRGELSFNERLAVEREYIDNLSLGRDLRIMLLTIAPVIRGRGAF